ncbi:MAG: hypothetical protein B7C24_02750 [Bacteroidetes bacterium 4572_77]|nr:MAG: hypothetical protein B7C24_02750 [Bacteroidetes bacterium 4572_77]
MAIFSQESQADIVYPIDESPAITNCVIKQIVKGNIVLYQKDGEEYRVAAAAVNSKGKYIDLSMYAEPVLENNISNGNANAKNGYYKGRHYDYYKGIYEGARRRKNTGMILVLGGASIYVY